VSTVDKFQAIADVFASGSAEIKLLVSRNYLKQVRPTEFPITLGQDFAGEVVESGEQVT
jgi:NADPH:quinone reductase-like Zn-dependent oxidoreductase